MRSSVEAPGQAPAPAGLFRAVWRQSLIYNQCWEDPALDREALRLTAQDRVMVITSAGCNAIDYASRPCAPCSRATGWRSGAA